ncbi:ABC transporter ATP-binding protein [Pelagibacterium halotolerans]|uniref:Branched-chain amino acid transport ATP-binding protein LivF n=1 Tax=Pelagibacterium halotolerans (strain DSM 22347 / JCM 15775 / CGMCC 1.7692 / B2) TaxID=1082931 RepID=G4R714_PELHB|nr:ABC transporter ATP-binding protein [Pelagibacterium halotolerans]AEQ50168.1 branched-chain amino acid transport ATP-binding protein LivF [Pelagibacterium halotolerans B2]QJR19824.1 ABC transporter ATP-binding protein [Pelagibacterium halotolerans]SEA49582.1 amino acid/amide ABC transporter ATP-binding protein 2, HAAT family [Pelagibacterium halotolerans]
MIETNALTAGYGDGANILDGISVQAKAGEIVAILGPNGCGKSTLLKCIAGYLSPRSGRITIEGRDVSAIPINRKVIEYGVGYVPQTDNVFATLSVAENILLGARWLEKSHRDRRYDELMEMYPSLANKQNRSASALSGGERQVLSLARALISEPKILLLDEPSAGLSPRMMHEVFDAISVVRDTTQMCIMMVEQNAYEALSISDRAYVLSVGKVAVAAPASDLQTDPAMQELYLGGAVEAH